MFELYSDNLKIPEGYEEEIRIKRFKKRPVSIKKAKEILKQLEIKKIPPLTTNDVIDLTLEIKNWKGVR